MTNCEVSLMCLLISHGCESCRMKWAGSLLRTNGICVSFDLCSCFVVGFVYSLG